MPDQPLLGLYAEVDADPTLQTAGCGSSWSASRHRDRPIRAGQSKHWVSVKNRNHATIDRVMDLFG